MPAVITTITTTTDTAPLLRLFAWLSPAFPTGAFAYSHALEWAVEAGDVRDAATLGAWITGLLRHGTGRSDAILLRHAHAAADNPATLDDIAALARAIPASRERQFETLAQGTAFLAAAAAWSSARLRLPAETAYPVAVGALAGLHGIGADITAACFLHAFATNLISAAVRLVPLGQTAGLAVLSALEPEITATAAETSGAPLDDIGGACFRSDIASMRHETQYTRLFRS